MEPDAHLFYQMPTAPQPRSYSRDRSPAYPVMVPARSTSRARRNTASSSQERPTTLSVHDGASGRHRSYHLTGPAPGPTYLSASPGSTSYQTSAPMGRSLSVSHAGRPGAMRVASAGNGNVQVSFATGSQGAAGHTRTGSGAGGIQYYYGSSRRARPVSYYGGSQWDGSAGSYEWDEWSPNHSPGIGHSPVGSYSRSPTRNPYEMPTAPHPPINAYRAEDDMKRLELLRSEVEHLKIREAEENERGRSAERRLREIRTQAGADPRLLSKVPEVEKQAAIAVAQHQEAERKRIEAEAKAARLERLATQQARKPQVILPNGKPLKPALKQTVAVTQNTAEASASTAVNKNMSEQAPPKNPQDYQAKIPKDLISRAALVEKGLTYEEHKDYLLVKRYLSKEDIKSLLDRTAEIRKQREAVDRYKASQAAAAAKAAEESNRPAVYTHTTTDGKAVQIVTMPQKTPPPEVPPPRDWKEEKKDWEAEKRARAEARAAEEAEWEAKRRANEERFREFEERERREREAERAKQRAKQKVQRKGFWY